jgi:hypothetical protein
MKRHIMNEPFHSASKLLKSIGYTQGLYIVLTHSLPTCRVVVLRPLGVEGVAHQACQGVGVHRVVVLRRVHHAPCHQGSRRPCRQHAMVGPPHYSASTKPRQGVSAYA